MQFPDGTSQIWSMSYGEKQIQNDRHFVEAIVFASDIPGDAPNTPYVEISEEMIPIVFPLAEREKQFRYQEVSYDDAVKIYRMLDENGIMFTMNNEKLFLKYLGPLLELENLDTITSQHFSNERNVFSLPFGMTSEEFENQTLIDPIYIENPNNPGELILDIDSMIQVKRIFDKCDYAQKLRSGEIPAQNPDGSYNAIPGELRFYQNRTHYVDSNNYEWIDSLEVMTYNCFEIKPTARNWHLGPDYFTNKTHYIDSKDCQWITLSYEKR